MNDRIISCLGKYIPYYSPSEGETSPQAIVDGYFRLCAQAGIDPGGKTVMEIGVGSTNGTGYEMICRGVRRFLAYEPFRKLDTALDTIQIENCCTSQGCRASTLREQTQRISETNTVPDQSVDLIVSHSVLEHVDCPEDLFPELARILKPGGNMLHSIDYRDHFFKYPFHFLQFSERIWNNFLNPGDLPRHRLPDHIQTLSLCGFETVILNKQTDSQGLERMKTRIHEDFSAYAPDMLSVVYADILVKKNIMPSPKEKR